MTNMEICANAGAIDGSLCRN